MYKFRSSWSKTERQNNKQAQARSLSFIMSDWGMGLALLEIAYRITHERSFFCGKIEESSDHEPPAKAKPTNPAPTKAASAPPPPPPAVKKPVVKSKWGGEDEEEDTPVVSLTDVR